LAKCTAVTESFFLFQFSFLIHYAPAMQVPKTTSVEAFERYVCGKCLSANL
jgi:hypothetical protein